MLSWPYTRSFHHFSLSSTSLLCITLNFFVARPFHTLSQSKGFAIFHSPRLPPAFSILHTVHRHGAEQKVSQLACNLHDRIYPSVRLCPLCSYGCCSTRWSTTPSEYWMLGFGLFSMQYSWTAWEFLLSHWGKLFRFQLGAIRDLLSSWQGLQLDFHHQL